MYIRLSDVTNFDDENARWPFYLSIRPALTCRTQKVVARAVHGRDHCPELLHTGPSGIALCAVCADYVDEFLMERFRKVRDYYLSPESRRTAVHELDQFFAYLCSEAAQGQSAVEAGEQLLRLARRRGRSTTDEFPQWLRAVYWQLIHVDDRQMYSELRRRIATRRGMATRPDRDLSTAKWALALFPDPVDRDLLTKLVIGLRDQVADPWRIPDPGTPEAEVRPRLDRMLALLRQARPAFYTANILVPLRRRAEQLDPCEDLPGATPLWSTDFGGDPAERYVQSEDGPYQARCRTVLRRIVTPGAHDSRTWRSRRRKVLDLLIAMCDVALEGRETDLVRLCQRRLGLDDTAAVRTLARFARLVVGAGVAWTDELIRPVGGPSCRLRPPAGRSPGGGGIGPGTRRPSPKSPPSRRGTRDNGRPARNPRPRRSGRS